MRDMLFNSIIFRSFDYHIISFYETSRTYAIYEMEKDIEKVIQTLTTMNIY